MDDDLRARLLRVRERIAAAAEAAGRRPDDVVLLLATKTQPVDAVRAAVLADRAAGSSPLLLGENRVQELVAKAPALTDLDVAYHLIGPLQTNKVNAALRVADSVDSVESVDLAQRLSGRCADRERPLDVMVQVNVSGEPSKHGVEPAAAVDVALAVAALPGLRLTGLQTVGANSSDEAEVRAGYAMLARLRDELVGSHSPGASGAVQLSMGMSGDLEAAIAEGATVVRVGTAVFGARRPPQA
ncbi:YggS family pyridoxal phosphate-dependent enzyme [Cellulomonas sp. T2.31MG-18]|uniref:YggS family pyridoxal phosphate-dependent enzyme n=1 Tax=Cellulomonas sp. T2.31MG-18 TaxID=3157619 RepID=UPI003672C8AB